MNQKNSFLDRGTLIALAIVMGFWILWSRYMETKYPQQNAGTATEVAKSNDVTPQTPGAGEATSQSAPTVGGVAATAPAPAPAQEAVLDYSDEKLSFTLTSVGMGLKKINIKEYTTRDNQPIVLSGLEETSSFSTTTLNGAPINFAIERIGQNEFVGRGTDGTQQIEKKITVEPGTYRIFVETTVKGENIIGIATQLADDLQPYQGSSFLTASYDHQDFFVFHNDDEKREIINQETGLTSSAENVSVLGLNDHYFAMGIVDRSNVAPKFETKVPIGAKTVVGRLIYTPADRSDTFTVKYEGFAGPKAVPVLRNIDERLTRLIDYGMFKAIAKPLIWLLRYFHDLAGNWGVAIILLTLLVRVLVAPFNIYSFKSMKVMQKIQPEMKLLREKYKSDPTRMNQEVMGLMKRHKANPLGGCLPMLLQLPVFIALFSALSMSIELYKAPFAFWVHDLSVKDPLYVFPVLMGVAMYFQQKLTPTTMDPQQAKVMQYMPIVFAAMMLGLPSGLTLYILVSTVFSIVQQYIFMRDRTSSAPATA